MPAPARVALVVVTFLLVLASSFTQGNLSRNPSCPGLMVMRVGWALAFRSLCGLVLAALFVPPLIARMRSEEALLAKHFGAEYEADLARTCG